MYGRSRHRAHRPRGDTKWQVSTNGGDSPRWLAGGRQLSYVIPAAEGEAQRVVVVDVTGSSNGPQAAQAFQWGRPRPLLSLPKGTTLFALANEGKRFLAATPVETNAAPRPLTVILNWLNGADQPAAAGR
jgi:hypothetical protein